MSHFTIVEQTREPSDKYEAGVIIDQDPDAGTKVTQGEGPITINVVVSAGEETVEMIDVVGDTYETAVTRLQQMDLKVDTPTREPSDDVEEGKVISSDPKAGEQVSVGSTVKLVISSGPETKSVTVPTLTGTSLDNARNIAESAGLSIGNVTEVYSSQPVGQVVYQSIPANTTVDEGTSIALQVSKGPEPSQPPQHTKTLGSSLPADGSAVLEGGSDHQVNWQAAEGYEVYRVTVDGKEAYKNYVNTERETLYVSVSGSGSMEVCIYFDDELAQRYTVNFDE